METQPEMETYILYVYCRRGGISRDAGEHRRGQFPDDASAIESLQKEVIPLLHYYDEVSWNIRTENGRKVK